MEDKRSIDIRDTKKQMPAQRGLLDRALLGTQRHISNWFKSAEAENVSKLFLRAKNLKRNLKGKKLRFINVDQATRWTLEWVQTFPERYDLIVGIPRSGMFIASLIALKLGKGLATPDQLRQGKYWHSVNVKDKLAIGEVKHILLVDDSVDSGRSMAKAIAEIRQLDQDIRISRASLIIRDEAKDFVDHYYKVVKPPRTYEWSILHRKISSHWGNGVLAVDLDGVLCAGGVSGLEHDAPNYLDALAEAKPYLIPAFEIDAIITRRPEKYRAQTEAWLARHGVRYKALYMCDEPTSEDKPSEHKIKTLLRVKPDMYWESDWLQSQEVWKATHIATLCTDEMTLLS